MRSKVIAFFISGIWISFSEFIRNEIAFKYLWIEKYKSLGLTFPSSILNNAIWGLWSFTVAGVIVFLSEKLKLVETVIVSWLMAFVMMWLVIGNMNVLPFNILLYAVPLSILEVYIAAFICKKILKQPSNAKLKK